MGNCSKVFDTETNKNILNLLGHEKEVIKISYNEDNTKLLTGSYDTTAKIYDSKQEKKYLI